MKLTPVVRLVFAAVAILYVCIAFVACQNEEKEPAPVFNISTSATAINNNGGGNAPGTTPAAPGSCTVSRLAGGIFGDDTTGCAGRIAGQLKVGCNVHATVTPKDTANVDVPPALHGNNVVFKVLRNGGVVTKTEDANNPFNYDMRATGVGDGSGYAVEVTLVAPGCPSPFVRTYEYNIQP